MTVKLNLGSGTNPLPDYINIDLRRVQGVEMQVNLFVVPWPFRDGSVDEIMMSHFVEHIPHTIRESKRVDVIKETVWWGQHSVAEPIWDEDGFFVVFREAWRVLKMDGLVEVWTPYFTSESSFRDPTHTRYLTEATFSYLWEEKGTFDYQIGCKFEQIDAAYLPYPEYESLLPDAFQNDLKSRWNVAHTFRTVLRKVPL